MNLNTRKKKKKVVLDLVSENKSQKNRMEETRVGVISENQKDPRIKNN